MKRDYRTMNYITNNKIVSGEELSESMTIPMSKELSG